MSKLKDFFDLVLRMDKMKKTKSENDKNGLTRLETGLFDSIEFCLGLLGTVPVPIFIVNSDDEVIMLNSPRFESAEKGFCCVHEGELNNWRISKESHCIFCETVHEARKKDEKIIRKGSWQIAAGSSRKELIVLIHATPVTIENDKFVFVALENITEVEQLKGLLPICMECNKIYDNGTSEWIRIDEFITERSPAKFSHGLCPICSERLMDDIDRENGND
ncbi:MAG: hypothetical protein A2020_06590 [Lentisphaerae bacterium GWF2_45_14]|nr:MAG: hypothetical protein A2020_06590 [Lentisphaerae bacterium GWF2_45_14]